MSEYQYYEFRAVDRPLDRRAVDELRAVSSRAEITAWGFKNTYSYGDFRGDPAKLMDRHFDVFVHLTSWGSRSLMIRLPRGVIDDREIEPFRDEERISLHPGDGHLILELRSEDDSVHEWIEGEEWMPRLLGIREILMRGDLRPLYIGWLASWSDDARDEDVPEPPVPAGLANLPEELLALAEYLQVDGDLLAAAASASADAVDPSGPTDRADIERWIATLSVAEKNAYLAKLLAGEGENSIRAELSGRYRQALRARRGNAARSGGGTRTYGELLGARDRLVEERRRQATDRAAAERARRLDSLRSREPELWGRVESLIEAKKAKEYDEAVEILSDLRELAVRNGREAEYAARVAELRRRHAKKPSLIARLDALKPPG